MEVLREGAEKVTEKSKAAWSHTASTFMVISQRLKLDAPLVVSRCTAIPVLVLFIQSLVIALLSDVDKGLGVVGGTLQLIVTCVFLLLLLLQMEALEVQARTYMGLSKLGDVYDTDPTAPTSSNHHPNTSPSDSSDTHICFHDYNDERMDNMLPR